MTLHLLCCHLILFNDVASLSPRHKNFFLLVVKVNIHYWNNSLIFFLFVLELKLSQTSVESVSHDDGDKDLFSDSNDNDTEDEPSKARTQVSDKSLPATTLLIDGKRVESSNTLAFCVDDFLPDPSLSRTKTITEDIEYHEDCDLEIATKLNTFNNRELKGRVSEPSLTGRDTVSVDSGKDNVSVPKTMFPALEIPSAQEMMVSATTLSNQYKRTIDAILNKGKKLKTDKWHC